MSSGKLKSQLRKARTDLHKKNALLKMYKDRISGDGDSLVNYVQGLAQFGEFAVMCLTKYEPDRASLVHVALSTWAQQAGLVVRMGDHWEATHLCKKETPSEPSEEAAPGSNDEG